MFRSYIWTVFRLRFLTYRLVIQDVLCVCVGGGTRSRFFYSGYRDPELLGVNNYMFRSYMWTVFRLRFLTYRLVIKDVGGIWVGGGYEI